MLSKTAYLAARLRHAHFYANVLEQVGHAAENDNRDARGLLDEHWLQIIEARKWLSEEITEDVRACELLIAYGLRGMKFLAMWLNVNEAIAWATEGLKASEQIADNLSQIRFLNELSRLYLMSKSQEVSLKCAEDALSIAKQINDTLGQGDAFLQIARHLVIRPKQRADSEKYFLDALECFKTLNMPQRYAWSLHNLAIFKELNRDLEGAKAILEEAINIFREIKNNRFLSNSLGRMGAVLEQLGNPLLGRKYIIEALEIARSLEDEILVVGCLLKLGYNAIELNERKTYYSYNQEAYLMSKSLGVADYTANALDNLANYHFIEGEYHLAEMYYSEAFLVYKELHYESKALMVVGGIAVNCAMQGKADSAIEILSKYWVDAMDIAYPPIMGCYMVALAYVFAFHHDDIPSCLVLYSALREKGREYYFLEEFEALEHELRMRLGEDALESYYEKREASTWEDVIAFAESLLEIGR